MTALIAAALVLGAYLAGSIPTGYLVGKHYGVNVRTQGSGNIGATNVARTVGKRVGVMVLLFDALKGAVPLLLWRFGPLASWADASPYLFTAFAVAPIVGHCFPVWLGFRGGKGVATALGVLLVADPLVVGIGAAGFALVYLVSKVVSLGSLTAALAIPISAALLGRAAPVLALTIAAAVIVIGKHHGNIRRLLSRRELKL